MKCLNDIMSQKDMKNPQKGSNLTLVHPIALRKAKLYIILAFLSAIGLSKLRMLLKMDSQPTYSMQLLQLSGTLIIP